MSLRPYLTRPEREELRRRLSERKRARLRSLERLERELEALTRPAPARSRRP